MGRSAKGRAVVLGASFAGLLAARVLSDSYEHVVLVDRDELPAGARHRRGVPQDRHIHALHTRGLTILDDLFPGFTEEAVLAGAALGDSLDGMRWYLTGPQPLARTDAGMPGLSASRPLLESIVRGRVVGTANVEVRDGADIVGVTAGDARVTGARIAGRDGSGTELPAELVVDATGRGSRAPRWLADLRYPAPDVERIVIDLAYCTCHYRLTGDPIGDDGIVIAATPQNPRLGTMMPIDGDRYIVTLGGMVGEHPPTDAAGFLAFAAALTAPDIAEALRDAEPVDAPLRFTFPADERRHYERLDRAPAGLLAIGDAVCSFNPAYGQGMTVAAEEAIALRELLADEREIDPLRWYRRIHRIVDRAWEAAAGGDLAFPGVTGKRTIGMRIASAYLPRLVRAATAHPEVARAIVRVIGMVDGPETLMRPQIVIKALSTRH